MTGKMLDLEAVRKYGDGDWLERIVIWVARFPFLAVEKSVHRNVKCHTVLVCQWQASTQSSKRNKYE